MIMQIWRKLPLWEMTSRDATNKYPVLSLTSSDAAKDEDGNSLDPFCGVEGTTLFGPFVIPNRTQDSNGWCSKKKAITGG